MQNKKVLIGMIVSTLAFAGLLLFGMDAIDPAAARWYGIALVTAALALFLWGLAGTLLLAHRTFRKRDRAVAVSLRQASFLSGLVILALYLQKFALLTWLNIVILVVLAVLLEIFFIGREEVGRY